MNARFHGFKKKRGYKANDSAYKNAQRYPFGASPTNQNTMGRSFYSNGAYNYEQTKAKKLISRARERDRSEKKYLALSQQVMPGDSLHNQENKDSQNMQMQDFDSRPITSAGGARILTGTTSNAYDVNGR